MKRMPLLAVIGTAAVLGLTGCNPASVATRVTVGPPPSAAATLAASDIPFALWAGVDHGSFSVTIWGGGGDCRSIASSLSTQSTHHLTVVFVGPRGVACADYAEESTYTFDTPAQIDASRPVIVSIVQDGTTRKSTLEP